MWTRGQNELELTPASCALSLVAVERAADDAGAMMGGFEERFHRVGGLTVRLRFAGPALVGHLTRAMAHLSVPPTADPQLTIRIWDSDSTQAPAPWRGAENRTVRGYFDARARGFFQWGDDSLSVLDADRGEGYYWVSSTSAGPALDRAAPLSSIFRSWLAERGIQLVHAGGVGTSEGCVLLIGGRGAGKSGVALASVASGLGCLGDDTCLIGPEEPPMVFSLYRSVQADAAVLGRLPFLESSDLPDERGGKALAFFGEQALLPEAPLRATAIVRVSGRRVTRLRRATGAEALAAIAPTSILRMPGPAKATLARLARVLEGARSYHLEAGTDPDGLAAAVEGLL